MANILYLRRMGCEFVPGIDYNSDVGNYRVRTIDECVPGKNGRLYFLEFSLWRDRKKARERHLRTGKPLKHIHYDIINKEGLHLDTEFTKDGWSYSDLLLETSIHNRNYSYTMSDILKAVNEISVIQYDQIVFIN